MYLRFFCIPVSQKRLLIEQNSEILDAVTQIMHIWDTFDLVVFKVILGSFGALVSKWPATPNGLA